MVNYVNYLFDLDIKMYSTNRPLQQAGPGIPSAPL